MLLKDLKQRYILNDGQVLNLNCDFSNKQIEARLSVRKQNGKTIDRCTIDIIFNEVYEIDLLDNFDVASYSDIVLVKTNAEHFYASFDPYGNSGLPSDNDNFVIKSHKLSLIDHGKEIMIS